MGRFLREHEDVDYLILGLHEKWRSFARFLTNQGWQVNNYLDDHLLSVKKDEFKLHLGHIEIQEKVVWKHNGVNGSIVFPIAWLHKETISFQSISKHCAAPELTYLLKTHPHLMNRDWKTREKDKLDLAALEAMICQKNYPEHLLSMLHKQDVVL
jgi:hypothetical protein